MRALKIFMDCIIQHPDLIRSFALFNFLKAEKRDKFLKIMGEMNKKKTPISGFRDYPGANLHGKERVVA